MKNVKHFIVVFSVFLGIVCPLNASADDITGSNPETYLKGDALKAVFYDTTMSGEYRQYRGDTKTYRYTEYHDPSGTTDYIEGTRKEPGIWTIIGGDKICYRYPNSKNYSRTYCFVVYNVDKCFYKFSTTDMTLKGPRDWDFWTSRAVRKGHGGSCEAPVG